MYGGIRVGDKLGDPPGNLGHEDDSVRPGRCCRGGLGSNPRGREGRVGGGFRLQVDGLTGAEDGADA